MGVGLDGGVFYYRHPQAQSMEGLFVVRFQMLLFFYLCLVMIFFACFSFFLPTLLGDDFLLWIIRTLSLHCIAWLAGIV